MYIKNLLASMAILLAATPAYGAVRCVPDASPGGCDSTHATIQAAIDASSAGDTVRTAPGTFTENIVLDLDLTLEGAQAGTDACGRVDGSPDAATESIIAPGADIGIELQTGSAGSTIAGFSFVGPGRGIESSTGPLDNLAILDNHFQDHSSAVFLNNPGIDITVDQNALVGSTGTQFHLDQDNFDGLHFTNNCVLDGAGTGLFVDGNHNIGVSASRAPLIGGNLFEGNVTGANLGRFAFEFGTITGNVFRGNLFPGLQGGIQNSDITENVFDGNGRGGLELTGFGGSGDATRGAQNNDVFCNNFVGNGFTNSGWGIFLSAGQFPGTISTNVFFDNNLIGNRIGLSYGGTEVIGAENNYWGDASGPTHASNPGGLGDEIEGDTVDFDPWADSVATCAPTEGLPAIVQATFRVTKDFTDDNPAGVEVLISCTTGLPLEQSLVITEAELVTFVVTQYTTGELDCDVFEAAPDGYSPTYAAGFDEFADAVISQDAEGCHFDDVVTGDFTCHIENAPDPVEVEIIKDWVYENSDVTSDVDTRYALRLYCEEPIGLVDVFEGEGSATFFAQVAPQYPSAHCWVDETVYASEVEVDNGCQNITVSAGNGASCTITNSVFFEGIPTLSRYGLAILAMLMLGIGLAGFRRFG